MLRTCAALSDPTPLAWLCARPEFLRVHGKVLAEHLIEWPETSLLKVLKSLQGPDLEPVLRRALPNVPLQRLPVIAMLERTLKHLDPDSYEAYLREIEQQLPSDRALALIPARALSRLDGEARQRRREMALEALEQLSRAPKAISLSNAEELLAKRVYTQPGHFLFELLQNAEDAGASTFKVEVQAEFIRVWHDGLPFDVRDLVGVTSIGQTTKKKQQIGFFGVGFKSVYEVTERPQIYSGDFQFEIIDVSIPRALEYREMPGTTLVLPLKRPFKQLPPLDPAILLALTHVQEIDWNGQLYQRHQLHYLTDESEHIYPGPARESGRPDRARLLLAFYLSGDNVSDLPEGSPTVYSYLPTSQPSGLRFLVHSHFDLPVDRERLNPESDWNQWLLSQIPHGLLRLSQRAPILAQLPLPGEALGPFAFLPEAIATLFHDQPCLPDGQTPARTRLASARMLALELPLELWSPSPRLREVARHTLKCQTFEIQHLIEELEKGMRPGNLAGLLQLLLDEGEHYSQRLRALPLFHQRPLAELARADEDIRAFWPETELVPAEWTAHPIFAALHLPRLGPADLLERLQSGVVASDPDLALKILARGSPEVRQQARRLPLFQTQFGLRGLEEARLCQQPALVEFYLSRSPLLQAEYADWNPTRLDWTALARDVLEGRLPEIPHLLLQQGYQQIPESLLRQLAELPLWPDAPLIGPGARLRPAHPQVPALLPELRFLPEELAGLAHVQALTPEPVGVAAVLEAMAGGQQSEAALAYLLEHADEIQAGASRRLLARARLPDDCGQLAPLGQMCRAESDQLRALYQPPLQRHFLGEAGQRLLERLGLAERLPEVGLTQLVQDLTQVHLDESEEILHYLASRAGELSRAQAETLLSLPLFAGHRLGPLGLTGCFSLVLPEFSGLLPGVQEPPDRLKGAAEELAAAALHKPAGPAEALAYYAQSPERFSQAELEKLLAQLAAQAYQGPELNRLPLWPTLGGRRLCADEVVDLQPLRQLMDVRPWQLSPLAWASFTRLLKPRPGLDLLRLRLAHEAQMGRPLSEQPDFLSSPEKVQAVAERLDGLPLVDGLGCLRQEPLQYCDGQTMDLLAADLLGRVTRLRTLATRDLPAADVIKGLKTLSPGVWRGSPDLRQTFYGWLLDKESEVFASGPSRTDLCQHPFWLTRQGRLLPAEELVLQSNLPDLGVDWYPHSEIPSALISALSRHLNLSQNRPKQLLESHLLPAYREAAARGQKERASQLFDYLSQEFGDRPGLLGGPEFPVLDRRGRFRPACQVVWPDPELGLEEFLDERLLSQDYSPEQVRMLRAIGLAQEPSWEMLSQAFEKPRRPTAALGLARLLAALYRRHGELVLQHVPEYRNQPWLTDALGAPRPPWELFVPGPECESLIGTHGRYYPDPRLSDLLGPVLLARLGLRDQQQVELGEVLHHLKICAQEQQSISFRVYQWLEARLTRLPELRQRLADQVWIYTDDGLWFNHRKVLGTHAFTYFGNRRGYWERGAQACPGLCRLFEIPAQVDGPVVREFLEEVGTEVRRRGDQEVLAHDRALPRMLLACYSKLEGVALDRKLPIILAQTRPGREKRLVAADHPALVSSDTPSLERLFDGVLVAQTGNLEQRAAVEVFHKQMGLRNLRDAYSVGLRGQGRDVSAECAEGLARLRSSLRSLAQVLPRVRRQREQLSPQGWLDRERLHNLTRVRAIHQLQVVYDLPGVGQASVSAPAAYHQGELLVDSQLVHSDQALLTGLAQGLLACVYQGPGEEQLVDILEILLPLTTRERMDAYLDARHFPAAEEDAGDPLAERLAEMIDFGLDQRLREQFPELGQLDPARLRGCQDALQAARALAGDNAEAARAIEEYLQADSLEVVLQPGPPPVETAPAEPMPARTTISEIPTQHEGIFARLANWVRQKLPGPIENPYTPSSGVPVGSTPPGPGALGPPASGLFHQPLVLPRPYLYAAHVLAGHFDPARQAWLALEPGQLSGFAQGHPSGRSLPFQGTLQPGLSRLPLPFYTRLDGDIQSSGQIQQGPGPNGELMVKARARVEISFRVEVLQPPRPLDQEVSGVPPEWRLPTLARLPQPAAAMVAAQRGRPAWERALAAQEFVQTRYAYDGEFAQNSAARAVMQRPHSGLGHRQLDVLHAGAHADVLGAGACYELNAMLCELLRHLGLPALLASGWILDEGFLEFPDHVFAVAVLQSADGPCLLPLDGTSSTRGPLRQAERRPPPKNPMPSQRPPAQPAGIWGVTGPLRQVDERDLVRSEEAELLQQELTCLRQAVAMVSRRPAPERASLAELKQVLRQHLPSEEVATALVRLLAGDYHSLLALPPAVEELVRLDLAQVNSVPVLQVLPKRPG
ncbi:MAG: ATP-binding protein [Vulcanimicrobiota bacterium]